MQPNSGRPTRAAQLGQPNSGTDECDPKKNHLFGILHVGVDFVRPTRAAQPGQPTSGTDECDPKTNHLFGTLHVDCRPGLRSPNSGSPTRALTNVIRKHLSCALCFCLIVSVGLDFVRPTRAARLRQSNLGTGKYDPNTNQLSFWIVRVGLDFVRPTRATQPGQPNSGSPTRARANVIRRQISAAVQRNGTEGCRFQRTFT